MNFKEIIQELENQKIEIEDYARSEMENPLPNIGPWEEIVQKGGEGEGEEWYVVHYFKDHDIYIQTTGFYSSNDGTSFEGYEDECSEVKPKEKTITVYE